MRNPHPQTVARIENSVHALWLTATGTYSVGECLVKDMWDGYDASYQTATGHEGYTGPLLGGVLNYKLFDAIRGALLYGGGLENVQQVCVL